MDAIIVTDDASLRIISKGLNRNRNTKTKTGVQVVCTAQARNAKLVSANFQNSNNLSLIRIGGESLPNSTEEINDDRDESFK